MKPYETLFIVRPDAEEEDLETIVGRVEDAIRSNGGTTTEPQVWGKRRLAYEVKTYREGIYVLISFEAPPEIVGKIREHFRFNEDIIRNVIVRQERRRSEQDEPSEVATPVEKETKPVVDEELRHDQTRDDRREQGASGGTTDA
jgi:small subunit ribosomal protein S6